ncbi:MAG: helix-turn-helix transcriptional regulator [Clostridia bacterium]|nr:helix-turn-helix transcriptional regulator [Clostridia bacterium]
MNYYGRLKDLREDNDIKQSRIAEILQTSQQQISKWETGVQMMGVDKYIKLAEFYNVSLDYLLGVIDTPRNLK